MSAIEIFATGGVVGVCLRSYKNSIVTSDYRGECICFSDAVALPQLSAGIRCKKMRLTLTPDRYSVYVEVGYDRLTTVFVVPLAEEELFMTGKIPFVCEKNVSVNLEEADSVFDAFQTPKEVFFSYNSETKRWRSNLGKMSGLEYKKDMYGLFIYHEEGEMRFSTFFDELVARQNKDDSLRVILRVNSQHALNQTLAPYRVRGTKFYYRFRIYAAGVEQSTSEGTSEGTSDDSSGDSGAESKTQPPVRSPIRSVRVQYRGREWVQQSREGQPSVVVGLRQAVEENPERRRAPGRRTVQ